MLSREELITAIDNIGNDEHLTIKQISTILRESDNTVTGWLSNERDFPVAERGARKRKHYSKSTVIKLCLYAYAMHMTNGATIRGNAAISRLNTLNIDETFGLLRTGHQNYVQVFFPDPD